MLLGVLIAVVGVFGLVPSPFASAQSGESVETTLLAKPEDPGAERIPIEGTEIRVFDAVIVDRGIESIGDEVGRATSDATGFVSVPVPGPGSYAVEIEIETLPEGIVIEAPRYRAFTRLAETIAASGGDFVEIAGNDDILFTIITFQPLSEGAIYSFARQGNPGYRHLVLLPVAGLGDALRALPAAALEHIHDY